MGRIVIITGCPGTGKSTVAALAARHSALEKSVHLHTDTFYDALSKGAIPPWLPASDEQNRTVIEAFLAAADCGRGCGAGMRKTLLYAGFFIMGWGVEDACFHTGHGSYVFLSSRRKEPKAAWGKIKQIFPRTPSPAIRARYAAAYGTSPLLRIA